MISALFAAMVFASMGSSESIDAISTMTITFVGPEAESLEAVDVEARLDATEPRSSACERIGDSQASTWRCAVPGATVDLVVRPRGFAPHVLQEFDIRERDAPALPSLPLQRGATLSGHVERLRPPNRGKAAPVRAELRPRRSGFHGDPRRGLPSDVRVTAIPVDSDGTLHLAGIAPGTYSLTVSQPGAATWSQPIALDDGEALHLDDPIRLRPPATLEVVIAPPRAPDETAWLVELLRLDRSTGRVRTLTDRATDSDGAAVLEDLRSGTLMVRISDVHGDIWHHETLELLEDELVDGAELQRFIDLPLIEVEGVVTRGDEALAGVTLLFGGGQGTVRRRATTDDDGRFALTLPREGEWPVDLEDRERSMEQSIEPVAIERAPGSSIARLEIELPDTIVRGVVLHAGVPVAEAAVTVIRWEDERKRRETILETDDEGAFVIEGASPGRLALRAVSEGLSSSWVETEVVEDLESPRLEIHLDAMKTLEGRVVFAGRPAPGVRVLVRAAARSNAPGPNLARSIFTDLDGRFTARVPDRVDLVDLIASADGLGALVTQRRVPERGEIHVALDRAAGRLELPRAIAGSASLRVGTTSLPTGLLLSTLTSRIEWTEDSLVIHGMAPGAYQLCIASRCDGGVLTPHGHLLLGDSIEGRAATRAADDSTEANHG